MRSKETGRETIARYIELFSKKHQEHIDVYGANLAHRLTGDHETCSITEFKAGDADRELLLEFLVKLQTRVMKHIEDRRPGANADPYQITNRMLMTICELD